MAYQIMTVCTGNICRSPMAEVVLREAFERVGLGEEVQVRSTAISQEEIGNPIDPRAQRVLRDAGYDVPLRQAIQVRAQDTDADLVLAMTNEHARALRAMGFSRKQVVLFRAFEDGLPDEEPYLIAAPDTPDPWYGDHDGFVECLETVERCARGIVEYVRHRYGDGTHP